MHHWPTAIPLAALALLLVALVTDMSAPLAVLCVLVLVGAVVAAVHHAEVVAHKLGEPLGTLVLALAVTVIEVALIVSMMLAGGPKKAALARDTVYAAVMIIVNGVVGLCLLLGGLRHREQAFRVEGAGPALAALVALTTLSLVLPGFTITAPGPIYSRPQLAFAAVASLALWAIFVFVQTVRHRDYFLPPGATTAAEEHAPPPSAGAAWLSFGLLVAALVAVVGLGKVLSPVVEAVVEAAGAPEAVIGIVISIIVLLPETWAAVRAARADRLQTSMNLALGSALASIGLTIPAVALASVVLKIPLVLGLDAKEMVLAALSFAVATITLGAGRTSMMQGAVHLVVFAAFLFLAVVP